MKGRFQQNFNRPAANLQELFGHSAQLGNFYPQEAVSFTVLTGAGFEKALQNLGFVFICQRLQLFSNILCIHDHMYLFPILSVGKHLKKNPLGSSLPPHLASPVKGEGF